MLLESTFQTSNGVFGCGAQPKVFDARDHPLERVPAVADALAEALPQRIDRANLIWQILNQGAEPSCVNFSTAYVCQGFEVAEAERHIAFDGHKSYLECGGDGVHGISAERLLGKTKQDGFPVLQSALRFKIDSYQWTLDLDTVLAALVAGRLCVIACLLPTDFTAVSVGTGPGGNLTPSNAYHQLAVTGYQFDSMELTSDGWVYGPNSWSNLWGKGGWYRLRMSYLRDKVLQRGLFYGYSITDAPDGDSVPVPTPTPIPAPTPIGKILGVYREDRVMRAITQIAGGTEIVLTGIGFGGALSVDGGVFWNGFRLAISSWADTRIVCRAPFSTGGARLGQLKVRLASGVELTGPSLTIL